MTCKDCKHFIERKQIWKNVQNMGYCYNSRAGKIAVRIDCPVNKWCDNKYEPKEDSWESVSK